MGRNALSGTRGCCTQRNPQLSEPAKPGGGLTPETLFQFHEHFLPLFLGAMQHWEKDQDIFSKVDYDAIMQAYASLPQMLQFVDFVTEYVENSASKEVPRALSN